ncbi:MAG: hypothetical protein AB1489_38340 [Acidobacteriota bacterium]
MVSRKGVFVCISLVIFLITSATSSSNTNINTNTPTQPLKPTDDASVKISFDGMIAIMMGNPERVTAAFLDVCHHTPTITITRVRNQQRTVIATLQGEQLRGTVQIDIESATSAIRSNRQRVSKYYAASVSNDANDFRWTVDFEKDLHPLYRPMQIKEEKLFGKIHINTGLFYADNLSEEIYHFVAADGSGKALPFQRQIATVAAQVILNNGESLVINGNNEDIRFSSEYSIQYEVAITNTPPPNMANVDHWLYYYDIILGVKA